MANFIETAVDGNVLTLSFANGEQLTVNSEALSAEIRAAAMLHGLKQKLCDAAAISRNPETGRSATIDDKYAAVREVFDRITAETGATWNKTREGGGSGNAGGLLFRALCSIYEGKRTPAQITEFLAKLNEADKAALRKQPKVKAVIDSLRPVSEDDPAASLLDELGAIDAE
jgi:frataxin-like iron-binding protein CyaY